jgi:hypothetical protein
VYYSSILTLPAILPRAFCIENRFIFHIVFSVFLGLNVTKCATSVFTVTILQDLVVTGVLGASEPYVPPSEFQNCWHHSAIVELKRKNTRIFLVCAGIGASIANQSQEILQGSYYLRLYTLTWSRAPHSTPRTPK